MTDWTKVLALHLMEQEEKMDMSDPSVQQMLDDDRAEALARIRARKVAEHNCYEVPWDHETTDGPLGDAYSCSICSKLMQVG